MVDSRLFTDNEGVTMSDSPVALITGGGSGIGAAVARQLLDAGHRVAITGRGEQRLRDFAAELGDPAGLPDTSRTPTARPRGTRSGRNEVPNGSASGHVERGRVGADAAVLVECADRRHVLRVQ